MARIPDKQAVFFELDGVLTEGPRLAPDGSVPWLPGAVRALGRIDPGRFSIFIATNRLDIAFGRLRERDFRKLCEAIHDELRAESVRLAKIYSCPFHPKGRAKFRKDSVFRKPAPGMFKIAQQEFDLNLARCWMVGHTTVDILAGSRAGVGTILVETGEAGRDGAFHVEPHFQEPNVLAAVGRINAFEHAMRL